jgi:thiol-disulfide isomerase/thioredoxin
MGLQMKKLVKIIGLVSCLMLVSISPGWSVEVGQPLPEFTIRTLDGRNIAAESLKGRPLLLVFWNTWCPNCMRELPVINRLAVKYSPRRLTVLAVNTAINDSESKARVYWKKSGFLFSTGYDHYFEIGSSFKILGVPTIILVDSKGIVRYKHARVPEDMDERLKQLSGKRN